MLYIDTKYVSLLSYKLRNFKQKAQNYWNFSCPICGDSKKDPRKARGYVMLHKTNLIYKCHNCGLSCNFGNLLKRIDSGLYSDYTLERYKENTSNHNDHVKITFDDIFKEEPKKLTDGILDSIEPVDRLPMTHPALAYLVRRKIPHDKWNLFYFAPKFKTFTNIALGKNKFTSMDHDVPRLVIPFFNEHGKCFMFQGRAFGNEEPKYFSIKIDDDAEKIYGLERVDYSKRVYVTEGPIDSLLVPNGLAVAGSTLDTPLTRSIKGNVTLIPDNEPRNKEIMNQVKGYIDKGYSVCLWPDNVAEKDINEMVLSGKSPESVLETINNNTYQGLSALLRYNEWRKV